MTTARLARKLFFESLRGLRGGRLEIVCPDGVHRFGGGELQAALHIHDERFFTRLLLRGDAGAGESYRDGDWSSPDLVSVIRLAIRNLDALESRNRFWSALSRLADRIGHQLRNNSVAGSRRNIHAHYDLSNDLYQLFLDRSMMYSCAVFESAGDSLETAQRNKIDRICRKLDLRPGDWVLEIGTGWGGFAVHAAREYGCRVTTTTISRRQYDYAREVLAGEPVELLLEDYRNLRGRYDKIVSIEMFEAVGYDHYDDYFAACDRLLTPAGTMLLQTITLQEQKFAAYRRGADWIQQYIFPGGELASVRGILDSLARVTRLSLFQAEDIGMHYAWTLRHWRERFLANLGAVFGLGFDEKFARLWEYYLAYCEGAFLERHCQTFQLLLTRNGNPGRLAGEPGGWSPAASRALRRVTGG